MDIFNPSVGTTKQDRDPFGVRAAMKWAAIDSPPSKPPRLIIVSLGVGLAPPDLIDDSGGCAHSSLIVPTSAGFLCSVPVFHFVPSLPLLPSSARSFLLSSPEYILRLAACLRPYRCHFPHKINEIFVCLNSRPRFALKSQAGSSFYRSVSFAQR